MGIIIDVCRFYQDSVFLQQAAFLTNGVYHKLMNPDGLVQYLLFAFLPPKNIRTKLIMPKLQNVDFRAACFCHKKMVSMGYVCSVCLSST